MAKKKLQRFAEIGNLENVFQHLQYAKEVLDFKLKGKWNELHFKNNNPIVLELGCGKGEYTIGLAEKHHQKNFIGLDLKGNRIWRAATTGLEKNLKNIAFLRTRIEMIEASFQNNEVSEIWITFPDPQPQKGREKKRLTSPRFLNYYKNIMIKGGIIHLKTDNYPLYEYTIDVIKVNNFHLICSSDDLYGDLNGEKETEASSIKTYYEKKYTDQGMKICYLKFSFQS